MLFVTPFLTKVIRIAIKIAQRHWRHIDYPDIDKAFLGAVRERERERETERESESE